MKKLKSRYSLMICFGFLVLQFLFTMYLGGFIIPSKEEKFDKYEQLLEIVDRLRQQTRDDQKFIKALKEKQSHDENPLSDEVNTLKKENIKLRHLIGLFNLKFGVNIEDDYGNANEKDKKENVNEKDKKENVNEKDKKGNVNVNEKKENANENENEKRENETYYKSLDENSLQLFIEELYNKKLRDNEKELCFSNEGGKCWSEPPFDSKKMAECISSFKNKYILMIGDSVTRNFVNYVGTRMKSRVEDYRTYNLGRHGNTFFELDDMRIQSGFIGMLYNDPTAANIREMLNDPDDHPDVIVYNSGLWDLKNGVSFPRYIDMLYNLTDLLDELEYTGQFIWRDTTAVNPEKLDAERKRTMTNQGIVLYNHVAREILGQYLNADIIYSYDWTKLRADQTVDGYHYGEQYHNWLLNVIFNMIC